MLIRLYEDINVNQDADGDGKRDNVDNPALIAEVQRIELALEKLGAIAYYVSSEIFSDWVYANLNNIKACDITDDIAALNAGNFKTESELDLFHSFKIIGTGGVVEYKDETIIFDKDNNPELTNSAFYSHKVNVIRNNIQYNLNLAISAYNSMTPNGNVQMPVIKDSEWEQILTRVSVTSFMQGLQCGMKVYNNYAIASSTNNELTMQPTEMYYTLSNEFNLFEVNTDVIYEYHKIDCELLDGTDGKEYISFTSKDIKYDKIFDRTNRLYSYDHRNLGCYRCAIPSNYKKRIYDRDGNKEDASGNPIMGYSDEIVVSLLSPAKQKGYYIGVANAKQSIYKTNALTDSNGFEVLDKNTNSLTFPGVNLLQTVPSGGSTRGINEVRELEITLSKLECTNNDAATVTFRLVLNGTEVPYDIVLNLQQATPQTMVVPVHLESLTQTINTIGLKTVVDTERYC